MFKAFQACLLPTHTCCSVSHSLCGLCFQTFPFVLTLKHFAAQWIAKARTAQSNLGKYFTCACSDFFCGCARKLHLISGSFSFMQGTLIFNNCVTIICSLVIIDSDCFKLIILFNFCFVIFFSVFSDNHLTMSVCLLDFNRKCLTSYKYVV